ncbi:diguanylate cyclase [bacterium]|nr:diguanylate cyclase [bacterium]
MNPAEVSEITDKTVDNSTEAYRIVIGINTLTSLATLKNELGKQHNIVEFSDGLKLLQSLHRHKPHLVILESDLATISGFQVAHIMRRHPDLARIPLMMIVSRDYQIGEFWAGEMNLDFCKNSTDMEFNEMISIANQLAAKSASDSIDDETWLNIKNELSGYSFVENYSHLFDQSLIEGSIASRIALLAQEPTDFRKMTRSIMLLLGNILEYSAGAIQIFRNNEIFSFIEKKIPDDKKLAFLHESEGYSKIYKPVDVPEFTEEPTEIPLGTFPPRNHTESESPTIFTVPLEARHTTLGTLTLETHKTAAKRDYYLKTLHLMAYHISLALNNALLYQEIHRLSTVDELTGLPNRRAFYEDFQNELVRCKRFNDTLSLAMLDIDHFKRVNDTYGHLQGDVVLKNVATVFSSSIRNKVDIIARYGGEEFVILLPRTSLKSARAVIGRLHKTIENHPIDMLESDEKMHITVSVGLVCLEKGADYSLDNIINAADKALYEAKETGRNRIVEGSLEAG